MDAATTTKVDEAKVALSGAKIIAAIKQSGVEFVLAVPDIVTSKGLLFPIAADKDLRLVRVCKEDECIGIAAGLTYSNKRALILIQYTGFLDSLNAIRAVAVEYKQPIVHDGRPARPRAGAHAEGVRPLRRAHHRADLRRHGHPARAHQPGCGHRQDQAGDRQGLYRLLPGGDAGRTEAVMMKRHECFEILKRHVTDEVVVAAYSSALEWNDLNPRELNFFANGAMGLGSSHALGIALGHPDRRVVVLDGDGSLLDESRQPGHDRGGGAEEFRAFRVRQRML